MPHPRFRDCGGLSVRSATDAAAAPAPATATAAAPATAAARAVPWLASVATVTRVRRVRHTPLRDYGHASAATRVSLSATAATLASPSAAAGTRASPSAATRSSFSCFFCYTCFSFCFGCTSHDVDEVVCLLRLLILLLFGLLQLDSELLHIPLHRSWVGGCRQSVCRDCGCRNDVRRFTRRHAWRLVWCMWNSFAVCVLAQWAPCRHLFDRWALCHAVVDEDNSCNLQFFYLIFLSLASAASVSVTAVSVFASERALRNAPRPRRPGRWLRDR